MNDNYPLNLRQLYERGCRVQPNNEIVTLINDGQSTHRMTYQQCQTRATRMASALQKFGLKVGDRVGSFMWNNGRHFVLYYAIPCMGAVLHTINIRLHPKELAYLINHGNDRVVFIDADLLPLFEKIPLDMIKCVELFVICGENEQVSCFVYVFVFFCYCFVCCLFVNMLCNRFLCLFFLTFFACFQSCGRFDRYLF